MKFIFDRFSREGLENLITPLQTEVKPLLNSEITEEIFKATVEQLLVDAMNEITVLRNEIEDIKTRTQRKEELMKIQNEEIVALEKQLQQRKWGGRKFLFSFLRKIRNLPKTQ